MNKTLLNLNNLILSSIEKVIIFVNMIFIFEKSKYLDL